MLGARRHAKSSGRTSFPLGQVVSLIGDLAQVCTKGRVGCNSRKNSAGETWNVAPGGFSIRLRGCLCSEMRMITSPMQVIMCYVS